MKNPKISSISGQPFHKDQCCVCGSFNCSQSTDHEPISLESMKQTIQSKKQKDSDLDEVKSRVNTLFKQLEKKAICLIRCERRKAILWLSQFHFTQLSQRKVRVSTICQILESNLSRLPSKNIPKLMKNLQKSPQLSEGNQNLSFDDARQEIEQFLSQFDISKFLSKAKSQLFEQKVIKVAGLPLINSVKSISMISNPEQSQQANQYRWKNILITKRSKQVQLSNKNITDQEMIKQIPFISSFGNIKEFQIRNNRVTDITCRLIASSMSFIISLDIRGNRISDQGVIQIVRGIKNLKSLMISECQVTDVAGEEIANGLPLLEMLWAEYTRISGECSIKLAQKPKLKVISFAGNQIDEETGVKLRKIFNCKGYLMI